MSMTEAELMRAYGDNLEPVDVPWAIATGVPWQVHMAVLEVEAKLSVLIAQLQEMRELIDQLGPGPMPCESLPESLPESGGDTQ